MFLELLNYISWFSIAVGLLSFTWMLWDILGNKHRQPMGVMEAVWPVTGLYLGPIAIWGYRKFGLPHSELWRKEHHIEKTPQLPGWSSIAISASHCGAGCTLGDIASEWAIFAIGFSIAGSMMLTEYIGDYLLAVILGIMFQYFAIAPMEHLGLKEGLIKAAKADILSLTAFEIGLFGWMALMHFVFFSNPHIHPNSATYWFMMQMGMIIGFATSWPANVWLIKRGIKEGM